jgi:hypothetical protein
VVLLVKLNADALAAKLPRRDQCRTGTGERVPCRGQKASISGLSA